MRKPCLNPAHTPKSNAREGKKKAHIDLASLNYYFFFLALGLPPFPMILGGAFISEDDRQKI